MRMNSYLTTGLSRSTSSGAGTTARNLSGSVLYVMIRNSRSTKRYGPGGKAGLVSGIAKARRRTSSSFMDSLPILRHPGGMVAEDDRASPPRGKRMPSEASAKEDQP